jgi:hypothetical protein
VLEAERERERFGVNTGAEASRTSGAVLRPMEVWHCRWRGGRRRWWRE